MSKIRICDMNGTSVGDFEMDDALLVMDKGAPAVHHAVTAFRAGARAGTASTKTKSEVSGSGQKPWRQKGLGRARSGYKQSPVWRGGGVAFGPRPRDYSKKTPKKVARLAFRRMFSEKVAAGDVRIIEEIKLEAPKSKVLAGLLKAMDLKGRVLLVMEKVDRNVALAARNIPVVDVVAADSLCVYELLRSSNILIASAAMPVVEERLKRGRKQ